MNRKLNYRDRDAEYRAALGLAADEALPKTIGTVSSGGGRSKESRSRGGMANPLKRTQVVGGMRPSWDDDDEQRHTTNGE